VSLEGATGSEDKDISCSLRRKWEQKLSTNS
jgi:hypothetical protein